MTSSLRLAALTAACGISMVLGACSTSPDTTQVAERSTRVCQTGSMLCKGANSSNINTIGGDESRAQGYTAVPNGGAPHTAPGG